MYDWLIVGAGFAGSVLAERLASQRNERVLIIDKRTSGSTSAATPMIVATGPAC
jgi:UDP-galactopyranose mutase